jgi:major membrane immunogen (membrane-anchored lipoprotein)
MRKVTLTLLIVASMALGGCYESTDITLHDPGVYRGGSDPLLAKQASPEQKDRLGKRFQMGQTDR